jgi:hypothetical protein
MSENRLQPFIDALRERARVFRAWEAFELGATVRPLLVTKQPVPPAINYEQTAELLERVAELLKMEGQSRK